MKNILTKTLTVFIFCVFTQSYAQKSEKVSKVLLTEIVNNEQFKNAVSILREHDSQIDQNSGVISDKKEGILQVKFTIIDKHNKYDYKQIVYSKEKNEEAFVFFDEYKAPIKNTEKSIFNGCKWKDWNNYGAPFCDYNWWCFSTKTARFQNQYRFKVCKNGYVTKVDYRIVKLNCGC